MKRLGNYTSQVLQVGVQSPLVSTTAAILGFGIGLGILASAPIWMGLPVIGFVGVILAYRNTF